MSAETTSMTVADPKPTAMTAAEEFELMQRQAKLFANSPLVPAHISDGGSQRGLANCYIALVLAKQMNENPLVVMQNIYIVHGRAGWSASYMIAKANASGIFKGVIRFKHAGDGKTRACTASAVLADTGEEVSTTVSMSMAESEGWTKNSKYKSMPDQMLIYRAATFLVRTYCPQVMLGYHTSDELEDVAEATAASPRLTIATVTSEDAPQVVEDKTNDAPTIDPLPALVIRAGDELSPEAMFEWLGRNNFESLDAALAVTGERRAKLVASLENELAKAVEKKGAKK